MDSSENSLVTVWGITFKPYEVRNILAPRSGGGNIAQGEAKRNPGRRIKAGRALKGRQERPRSHFHGGIMNAALS